MAQDTACEFTILHYRQPAASDDFDPEQFYEWQKEDIRLVDVVRRSVDMIKATDRTLPLGTRITSVFEKIGDAFEFEYQTDAWLKYIEQSEGDIFSA